MLDYRLSNARAGIFGSCTASNSWKIPLDHRSLRAVSASHQILGFSRPYGSQRVNAGFMDSLLCQGPCRTIKP